jgi:hypothetical protein
MSIQQRPQARPGLRRDGFLRVVLKKGRHKAQSTGLPRWIGWGQRVAMYIVISKPKRKSIAAGVCHCMEQLLQR